MNIQIHNYLAQNSPASSTPLQRIIEDESEVQTIGVPASNFQTNYSVLYGLGAILLVVIAIGAASMFWKGKTVKVDEHIS